MKPHGISRGAKIRYGFPKEAHLLRSADFRKVYNEGRRRGLDFVVVFALANDMAISRIGLTVSRAVGGSVERNLVKRRLREAARKHLAELGPGWDVVFNARKSAKLVKFGVMEEAVRNVFLSFSRIPRGTRFALVEKAIPASENLDAALG